MKTPKNIVNRCFAACAESPRLLSFLSEAARRAATGGLTWEFGFSASSHFRDDFTPSMSVNNLNVTKFFEGKFRGAKIKTKVTTSKKGRSRA